MVVRVSDAQDFPTHYDPSATAERLENAPKPEVPPWDIASDVSGDPAEWVYLLPSIVECREVRFPARYDGPDPDPPAHCIRIKDLRRDPDKFRRLLAFKKTRSGARPALEMLAEALKRAERADAIEY
jgi:hypothetical protein